MPKDKTKNVRVKSKKDSNDIDLKNPNIVKAVFERTSFLRRVVQDTIVSVQTYKNLDVMSANDLKQALETLQRLYANIGILEDQMNNNFVKEQVVKELQTINTDISSVFRSYGAKNINDLLFISIGCDYVKENIDTMPPLMKDKYNILQRYARPISYKVIPWKNDPPAEPQPIKKNRIIEDISIAENADTLESFDLARTMRGFYTKVYGVKVSFRNYAQRKTLIINCLIDDVMLDCTGSSFIEDRINQLKDDPPSDDDDEKKTYSRFLDCLTIKDLLVYRDDELKNRYVGYTNQVSLIKQKTISQVTKEFLGNELYLQRNTLMQLLLKCDEHEYQYLAYLLYDLLTNDSSGSVDTHEQTMLFDSLPWNVKKYFRDAMKQTINYTNNLSSFDNAKIPLEQQICLLKANDSVKEKAMLKLKEVKAKSEDSGSKARQYLEGLLRIPFGIYRDEPILNSVSNAVEGFNTLVQKLNDSELPVTLFPAKDSYSSIEVRKYSSTLTSDYVPKLKECFSDKVKNVLTNVKRNTLIANVCNINNYIKTNNVDHPKLLHSGKKVKYMQDKINEFVDKYASTPHMIADVAQTCGANAKVCDLLPLVENSVMNIDATTSNVTKYMGDVEDKLNAAVHGHEKAKRQVERIIGQWINGEQTGYCFGFEGPPGVGKTSLAKKGIAQCLKDDNDVSRPFAFIAVGGSSNASTLDGHNYTYVGSTWGRIVDILMETKCMNPIIFIDELDKVSRTEHGKEIIGILTHLIDPTQNDTFQDKYFTGVDLDLSRALFVFSYNDVDAIDRILLDRIHRVKFDHLSLEDKLTITRDYLFPEIYSKMGLVDVINISDEVVEYIVEEYTCEPGVRKLKEILFEIVGEINLSVLQSNDANMDLPIEVTIDDVKNKYLKDRHEIRSKKIHTTPRAGLISGLWANALGRGGVLPIEVSFVPSHNFLDLKLTGMQGDVMKESMTMAKTLACQLAYKHLGDKKMGELIKKGDTSKMQGIHIHVPEGATPKDGPSAGTAITTAIYSLLVNKKIRHDVAITGEMCLQGMVTAIGGLDLKILGGIKAGVKTFIYPKENDKDFNDFMEKYKDKPVVDGIAFVEVETIDQVLDIVFVEE